MYTRVRLRHGMSRDTVRHVASSETFCTGQTHDRETAERQLQSQYRAPTFVRVRRHSWPIYVATVELDVELTGKTFTPERGTSASSPATRMVPLRRGGIRRRASYDLTPGQGRSSLQLVSTVTVGDDEGGRQDPPATKRDGHLARGSQSGAGKNPRHAHKSSVT